MSNLWLPKLKLFKFLINLNILEINMDNLTDSEFLDMLVYGHTELSI